MWEVTLIMLILKGDAVVQVWSPSATYQTLEVCAKAGREYMAIVPATGDRSRAVCVDAATDRILVVEPA